MRPGARWLGVASGWVVVLSGCSRGPDHSPEAAGTPGVGETLAAVPLAGDRPALVWVFSVERCLGCRLANPARIVRGLQRGLGGGLETVVVAVGEGRGDDRGIVNGFLASQRIGARVEVRSRDRYMREFGAAPLGFLYVTNRNAVIEAALAGDSVDVWRSADGRLELADFVARLAEEEAGPEVEGSGTQ